MFKFRETMQNIVSEMETETFVFLYGYKDFENYMADNITEPLFFIDDSNISFSTDIRRNPAQHEIISFESFISFPHDFQENPEELEQYIIRGMNSKAEFIRLLMERRGEIQKVNSVSGSWLYNVFDSVRSGVLFNTQIILRDNYNYCVNSNLIKNIINPT